MRRELGGQEGWKSPDVRQGKEGSSSNAPWASADVYIPFPSPTSLFASEEI